MVQFRYNQRRSSTTESEEVALQFTTADPSIQRRRSHTRSSTGRVATRGFQYIDLEVRSAPHQKDSGYSARTDHEGDESPSRPTPEPLLGPAFGGGDSVSA